jgi:hypothetical protein
VVSSSLDAWPSGGFTPSTDENPVCPSSVFADAPASFCECVLFCRTPNGWKHRIKGARLRAFRIDVRLPNRWRVHHLDLISVIGFTYRSHSDHPRCFIDGPGVKEFPSSSQPETFLANPAPVLGGPNAMNPRVWQLVTELLARDREPLVAPPEFGLLRGPASP